MNLLLYLLSGLVIGWGIAKAGVRMGIWTRKFGGVIWLISIVAWPVVLFSQVVATLVVLLLLGAQKAGMQWL